MFLLSKANRAKLRRVSELAGVPEAKALQQLLDEALDRFDDARAYARLQGGLTDVLQAKQNARSVDFELMGHKLPTIRQWKDL